MKICIISDLHCKYKQDPKEKSETFLFSNSPRIPWTQNPVAALLHLIDRQNLKADYLVCPGDLGDKADEQGIFSSWQYLEELNSKFGSKVLIGIPGNHDINSRKQGNKEPFDYIKTFHERFPLNDDELKLKFWENRFCILENNEIVFLLINTVSDHTDELKANESQMKAETLLAIEKAFESNPKYKTAKNKIAVLHHHPVHHSNIQNWRDTDMIQRGDKLITTLNKLGFQLLIHGHKHQPRLIEVSSLPIFAAGSFSSFANLEGTGFGSMFHIIEMTENCRNGDIYSWEFDVLDGWTQKLNSKFPPRVGFGATKTPEEIAQNIDKIFSSNGKKQMLFDDFLDGEPDIRYSIPEKLIAIKEILLTKYKLVTQPEFPIEPNKIARIE